MKGASSFTIYQKQMHHQVYTSTICAKSEALIPRQSYVWGETKLFTISNKKEFTGVILMASIHVHDPKIWE